MSAEHMEEHSLGLESGTVRLLPWDARWPRLFDEAAAELRRAIGGRIVEVHHVGSTAVPGLPAKPILDVLVGIPAFRAGLALVPALAERGYEHRPDEDIPDRHYFRRRRGTARTHHLSLAEPGSHHHTVTLAFRDALRGDPVLAARYAELKTALAERFPYDREAYLTGKSSFVREVLARFGLVP